MWVFQHKHYVGLKSTKKSPGSFQGFYLSFESLGDSSANEWKWLWNVHMQICRVHHQRPANHIHTGEHQLHRFWNKVLVGHTCVRIFIFNFSFISQTETHALFQKTNDMGDSEPETVVIGWFFCIEHILTHVLDFGYEGFCALQEPWDKCGMPSITGRFYAV